ncbi:pentapeptide repeat-containing protein [Prescottella equi]|uniref:pentapeptide repeat-containing protein n=1 Tax=Rhodococcus hoagii TaxID=43767 RepID=UPI001C792AA8|nr:pentapeptide repeat-containing protein [Prescottella equi]BCN51590.1 hypothetical protein RE9416_48910 [Prescottella equi]BCN56611.1 hypothetical protein RE9425_50010 [Prescottella equi]BCN61525.1 hypothetical protein RE9427_48950 [Prescottella equi]BCN86328.1 hypothetical protein RE0356_49690 [Prescottella equi]
MNATSGTSSTGSKGRGNEKGWSQKHRVVCGALWAVVASAAVSVGWWIGAEWRSPDGHQVWSRGSLWAAGASVLVVAGAVGVVANYAARQKRPSGGDASLAGLVAGGVAAAIAMMTALVWAQVELFTLPGTALSSIGGQETVAIVRSAAFGVGAFGAVAVLLVSYRRQKSTEAALALDRQKHTDAHALEKTKHEQQAQSESRKQKATEIAALHDRFAAAVSQLADDKPAIRLGGVYAIAGVATDWRLRGDFAHLQACADLLCAYVRSAPPEPAGATADPGPETALTEDAALQKDRDVRKAALTVLSQLKNPVVGGGVLAEMQKISQSVKAILNPPPPLELDLRGALLAGLDLRNIRLTGLALPDAELRGANLSKATLTDVDLTGAKVDGADFDGTTLTNVQPGIDTLRSNGAINLP